MSDAQTQHALSPTVSRLDVDEPPTFADGSVRQLDPASVTADTIGWWILTGIYLVVGAVALPILWFAGDPEEWFMLALVAAWLVVAAALVYGTLRWPALAYRHTSYIVSPVGLEIRRGVLWRTVIDVPRSRVQHTDVTQGPVMRRFGLAALTVHTAGTDQAAVTLVGLSHETALRVRDVLIRGGADDGV